MNRYDNPNEKKQSNRDPITNEPGSHPVGTGVGAVAGGAAGVGAAVAAGAAAGTAAGPIGTAAGAIAGGVIGALGGRAAAEHMNPTGSDVEQYLDYSVVDRDNSKVGSIDAVWQDHSGHPAYLGIKTGWLGMGRAHVVPAQSAEVSEATRKIRLPYTAEVVKGAPAFEEQADIDEDAERAITEYYTPYGFGGSGGASDLEDVTGTTNVGGPELTGGRRTEDEVRMPLTKEELKIGKREVEVGGIRLRKIVRTETVNQPVELQREEIVVERVPATGARTPTRADVAFREEEIYIPLRREEAVVEKTARITEEVRVGKKRETERRDITETVRREDVDIQRQGDKTRGDDKSRL